MTTVEHTVVATPEQVLVVGRPGMGKSSLLTLLGRRLSDSGHLTFMHRLRETPRVPDLASEVVRLLLNLFSVPVQHGGVRVPPRTRARLERLAATASRSERAASLDSVLDALHASVDGRGRVVLLADGLDELQEPDEVILWLRDLAIVRPEFFKLVITSRPGLLADRVAESRFTIVELRAWGTSEARAYLKRIPQTIGINETLLNEIISFSDGSPRALSLLAGQLGNPMLSRLLDKNPITLNATLSAALDLVFEPFGVRPDTHEDLRKVCLSLALFGPASVASLARITQLPQDRIDKLRLEIQAMATLSDEHSYALHDWVKGYILTKFLLKGKVDVGRLNFGTEAAETDPLLRTVYVPRSAVARVLRREKTIVLGDRGAGKSAIFRELTTVAENDTSAETNRTVVASSHEPSMFVQHFSSGDASASLPEQFRAVWLVYVAYLAAVRLQRPHSHWSAPKRLLRQMHTLLRGLGHERQITDESRLRRSIAITKASLSAKVKLKIGAIEVEPTWTGSKLPFGGFRNQVPVMEFLHEVDLALTTQRSRLIVAFDQIDEAFKYDRSRQEALIQGLFLAESSVATLTSISMAFLLRTDLYEIYDIQEKNKLISRTLRLRWTRSELVGFLVQRVFSNGVLSHTEGVLSDLISDLDTRLQASLRIVFPAEVEGVGFEDWLFHGLQNGHGHVSARQIVSFLNESRDSSVGSSQRSATPLFTTANVTEAMTRLSKSSYGEVLDDYRVATQFVRNCRAGQVRDFALSEVTGLFGASEGTIAEQVEQLERVGFLERYTTESAGAISHRFRIPVLYTRWWG
jgi:energy-coupling factor transporter ATP-binding protein EcfA2/Cdc6-like AAA superfamily ATPase